MLRGRWQAREASVLVEAVVEVERVVRAGVVPPLALTKGPTRFGIVQQLIQRDADIFLIKLLSIIGAAGIPAESPVRSSNRSPSVG